METRRAVRVIAALLIVLAAAAPLAHAANGNSQAHVKKRPPQSQAPDASESDDDGATSGVQVNPRAGDSKNVVVKVRVDDDNGHNDVSSVTVTVYQPDNATVHRSASTATKDSGNGRRAVYTYSFHMDHYDPAGRYYVKAVVQDRDGDTDTTWSNFTYQSLAALSISTTTVDLNPDGNSSTSVAPNASTHANPSQVTITNDGNVAVDLEYSGTHLTNATTGDTITVDNVHLSYAANMSSEFSLTTSATTDTTFDLLPGLDSSKDVHFAIHVPTGVRPGTYTGSITLGAVSNQ